VNALAAWLRERTGCDAVWRALFERRLPALRGPAAWLYTLGSAALAVLCAQAFTGALLAMSYAPTPDHAYDSVRYISERMLFGRFLRGLHHWGASFMVVLAGLHMLRVYFLTSALGHPRIYG